ncbi:uncharacterized protein LAJ45_04944 [Morchella importuna]|uniref:uncharacterized protein n=1 Tax=Morchella importuna TaxID=1174673 RepID=UPI001E8EEF68|nr:uncharacterized protein LAJ45_04944 [Morchella importuna]KAH8150765.1 hypothetical protein LAJ45_04944 [Morchella importuna]
MDSCASDLRCYYPKASGYYWLLAFLFFLIFHSYLCHTSASILHLLYNHRYIRVCDRKDKQLAVSTLLQKVVY